MKGVVGFVTGLIGFCFFAAIGIIFPIAMRREGPIFFIMTLIIAFVFLNVLVVGFFRMLAHLHEGALYPDDPYYHPQRGRALFFVGYIGLLATLGMVLMIPILIEVFRVRIGPREGEPFLVLAWFVGWIFLGLMLGGVALMLRDIYQKLFFGAYRRRTEDDGDFDIRLRRRPPRGDDDAWAPRRRDEEDDRTEDQRRSV